MIKRCIAGLLVFLSLSSAVGQHLPPVESGQFHRPELVELIKLDPHLKLDIRYASANNFVGQAVYEQARAFLQRPAAAALLRAHRDAKAHGFGFIIFDAYRPWHVTKLFWERFPAVRTYLADPAQGSRHNRGCAVDLSLYDLQTGYPIAMPSEYDDFSEKAHPNYAGGSSEARTARDRLRQWMEAEGFSVYENEWWHFDCKDWRNYPIMDIRFADIR